MSRKDERSLSSHEGDRKRRKRDRKDAKRERRGRTGSHDSEKEKSRSDESGSKRKKDHHSRRKKKRSRSPSSDSYSSSSEEVRREKRRRERKKRKEKRKRKKKDRKKEKKRDRRDSSSENGDTKGSPPSFGKYGILKASDRRTEKVQRSFAVWMAEIKSVDDAGRLPSAQAMEYFEEYREDYNTATLPHKKYYDYNAWEMRQHVKDKEAGKKQQQTTHSPTVEAPQQVRLTREQIEDMKHQASLRTKMQLAFQQGDTTTYQRLKERLAGE